jgi:hypothetical protein
MQEGLTYVTVDRSPFGQGLVPYDGVNAIYQTSKTSPCHEQASSRVPSYGVNAYALYFNHSYITAYLEYASRRE